METQSIEFKPSWRDEHFKVISSFANADGGNLIIGVDDDGNPVGIKNSKKLLVDIPNKVRNKLGIIPSVNIEKRRNKEVVKVVVKPSSVPISYDGKYYIRSGSTTQELKGKFLTETDIQTTDIVEGNLFEQLENTLEILRSKYLKSNISYEGIHRRDILEYPYDALREAVINALIHRDYIGTSNIQIRVYDDKLIITNEGKLPPEVPVEKFKQNICQNQEIRF